MWHVISSILLQSFKKIHLDTLFRISFFCLSISPQRHSVAFNWNDLFDDTVHVFVFFTLSPTQLTRWDYIVLWNTWQFRISRLPMNLTTAETMRKHRPTHTHNHTILYRPCVYTETKIFSLLFFSLVLNSCSFLLELTSCVFFLICFFCSNNRFFFVAISLFHLFFWYFVFYCLALNFLRKKTTFVCLFKQCCKTLNVWIVQKKNGNILFVAEVAQLWCEIC